jgi:hypothetical protein
LKFQEAKDLIEAGGIFVFENAIQLNDLFDGLNNDLKSYQAAKEITKKYVQSKTGACRIIMDLIMTRL